MNTFSCFVVRSVALATPLAAAFGKQPDRTEGGKNDPPLLMKDKAWNASAGSMLVGMKPTAPCSKAAHISFGSSRSEIKTKGA